MAILKELIQTNDNNENIKFPYVCFDVETDGLSHNKNEILEIVAIEFNKSGMIGEKFSFLCSNQSGIVPYKITELTGITSEMIKGKKSYLKDGIREMFATFVGDRPVVGQNVGFDIRFSKVAPKNSFDVLKMARTVFVGSKNFKLKDICKKLNIEFDAEKAHRAEYDVRETILCFIELDNRLQGIREDNATLPLFRSVASEKVIASEISVEEYINEKTKTGVVLTQNDINKITTQAYSYSRLNQYRRCALQWYYTYVLGKKQHSEPMVIGITCHDVADAASKWCYLELFINKLTVMLKNKYIKMKHAVQDVSKEFDISGDLTYRKLSKALYRNKKKCQWLFDTPFLDLLYLMDEKLNLNDYEVPSMPSYDIYNKIVYEKISKNNVIDEMSISEIKYIMRRFYNTHDFSLYPGDIMLTEKSLAFNKNWEVVDDWFGSDVFWRAKIDKIRWEGNLLDIEDYKTNRVVPSLKELKESMQLKSYIKCVVSYIGRENVENIRIRLNYLRHNEKLEIMYSGNEIDEIIAEVDIWIFSTIKDIESQLVDSKNAFKPCRNEYCSNCSLFQDGICPLFDIKKIGDVKSPDFIINNANQCIDMYKRTELLQIERDKIIKQCKEFAKKNENDVLLIDKVAKLDFHKTEVLKINVLELVLELLRMQDAQGTNIDLKTILRYLTISKTNAQKLSDRIGVNVFEIDGDSIVTKSIRQEFKALVVKDDSEK